MKSLTIGIDYAWNGWLDKFYPRYRGTFHARRKRGTHEIYKIDFTTELGVIRLVHVKNNSQRKPTTNRRIEHRVSRSGTFEPFRKIYI